jgi:hypothetical protein
VSALPPLRAPTADGAVLAVPPLAQAGALIAENRDLISRVSGHLLGRPWQDVRRLARAELLAAAREHTGGGEPPSLSRRDEPAGSPDPDAPLFLAGHQPELFHPGVWVKSFALAGLARRHQGAAVNLLVDNDTVKSTALVVPARGDSWPEARALPFDQWKGEVPWEERRVLDRGLFDRFGDEATAALAGWGVQPLLPAFWIEVRREVDQRGGLVGASFAAARRRLERAWGCANLEAPLSALCRGEAFAHLAGALLAELPRFVAAYNGAVRDHRARHGIRSRHHPVPDLAADGDWLEAPLWGWMAQKPRRARLFARVTADRVELRAGGEAWPSLPSPASPARFVEAWRGLEAAGYKVRSRALITTLFARLFLADLFVHGIGGGKYDELTDELMAQFWGLRPPRFAVLSATRLLPLPAYPATPDRQRVLARLLRDLEYNPQRHVPDGVRDGVAEFVREREELAAQAPPTRAGRRARFRRLRELNDALRPAVRDAMTDVAAELGRAERELRANALLRRRDFAFCLYPEATLRPFCTAFL